jgi:hypothetical protein
MTCCTVVCSMTSCLSGPTGWVLPTAGVKHLAIGGPDAPWRSVRALGASEPLPAFTKYPDQAEGGRQKNSVAKMQPGNASVTGGQRAAKCLRGVESCLASIATEAYAAAIWTRIRTENLSGSSDIAPLA